MVAEATQKHNVIDALRHPVVNGFTLIVIEEQQRLGRRQWVMWHRCELHQSGQLVTITRRVSMRSTALEDGTRAALEMSGVE